MVRRWISTVAAFFVALSATTGVRAQGAVASATAESLFREGKELMAAGKYPEACDKFEAAYEIEETLGTLLNLANCHELEGRTASAWAEFIRAGAVARDAGQADREKVARERAKGLEVRLIRLQIEVAEAARVEGLTLERDGVPVEPAAWGVPIPVDPGEHVLRARAPGKKLREDRVHLETEGSVVLYELEPLDDAPPDPPAAVAEPPGPVAADPPAPAPPPPAPVDVDLDTGSSQRTIGLVVGAVGVAGLAGGAVLGALAKGKWDDAEAAGCASGQCPTEESQKDSEDAKRFADYGTIALAGGGVLLASGVVLYLTAPSASSTALATRIGPHSVGLELGGTF